MFLTLALIIIYVPVCSLNRTHWTPSALAQDAHQQVWPDPSAGRGHCDSPYRAGPCFSEVQLLRLLLLEGNFSFSNNFQGWLQLTGLVPQPCTASQSSTAPWHAWSERDTLHGFAGGEVVRLQWCKQSFTAWCTNWVLPVIVALEVAP